MRRYRLRHAADHKYKARIRAEKRKQLAKNPQHHKERSRIRTKRYREKNKDTPEYKAKAIIKTREWRLENPERARESQKKWAQANPAAASDAGKRYRTRDPEGHRKKVKEYQEAHVEELRQYRLANADRIKERMKRYYAARPGIEVAYNAARRARQLQAMPPWADRKAIASIYRMARDKSKETGISWHVDHIVPLRHKLVCGLHVAHNLQILPFLENVRKSNKFSVS